MNLGSDENIILIHQALYRIFALTNKEYFVLHGSAVCVDGNAILLGDSGNSMGKTTQSLFLYKGIKGKYIADEFVLYKGGYVYSNPFYPIHVKPSSKAYMEELLGEYTEYLKLPKGEFVSHPVPLKAIVCPVPSGKDSVRRLFGDEAREALKCTAYAHLVKLHHPECDRANIFTKSNNDSLISIRDKVKQYKDFDTIPIYELQISHPRNITKILKKGGVFMKKTIKNHVSCGGVVFNEDMSKIYLINKIEREDWVLPKGHVEEGEDSIQTATREVFEETGYKDIKVLDTNPSGIIEYDFEDKNDLKFTNHKIVRFYPMQVSGEQVKTKEMEEEGLGGKWVPVEEVLTTITYEQERQVIKNTIDKIPAELS